MTIQLKSWLEDLLHVFYPHYCEGCGTDVLNREDCLCVRCRVELPETGFFRIPDNPAEKLFYGRLDVTHAAAGYYYTHDSLIRKLLLALKYSNRKDMGLYLGRQMGYMLKESTRFDAVDLLLPVPLHPGKERKRGYNQSLLLCEGIASVWPRPIVTNAIIRKQFTEAQAKKDRVHRWQNMQEVFMPGRTDLVEGKHILLVDDVLTTGATAEACGAVILKVPGTRLSIATVGKAEN